jgi:hypothetical protein
MAKSTKELPKYSNKCQCAPSKSHVLIIHEMITKGIIEIGSYEWTNFFAEIDSIDKNICSLLPNSSCIKCCNCWQ